MYCIVLSMNMFNDIIYTLAVIGALLLINRVEIVNEYVTRLWERNKNKTLNDLLMELLWNTSYTYTFVKYRCGKLYSTFPLVRSFVDALNISKRLGDDQSEEIVEYPWASITQLIETDDGKLSVIETTFDLNDFEWQYKSLSENLVRLNHICKDLLQNNEKVCECLLLVAENTETIRSRVINRKNMDMSVDTNIKKQSTETKFLIIDYVHPTIDEPKEVVLDKAFLMEENHLLSGAFVGRLFAKEGYSGPFDKSYRIVIIDKEVNPVEWSYSDFIELISNKNYVLHLDKKEEVVSANNIPNCASTILSEDEDTKSWDKVDKEKLIYIY